MHSLFVQESNLNCKTTFDPIVIKANLVVLDEILILSINTPIPFIASSKVGPYFPLASIIMQTSALSGRFLQPKTVQGSKISNFQYYKAMA